MTEHLSNVERQLLGEALPERPATLAEALGPA